MQMSSGDRVILFSFYDAQRDLVVRKLWGRYSKVEGVGHLDF